jgi:endoglucanase
LNTLALLKEISQAHGPSGRENSIGETIASYWETLVDNLDIDALGNLIGLKKGKNTHNRSIMVATQMDEKGLIVTGVEGDFIRINNLAGMDRRVILGSEVTVHGQHNLDGVIGSRPPHVLARNERNKIPPWHELFVDVGLSENEINKVVRVGDSITIKQNLSCLKNNRVAGKALDNRASVTTLTLVLMQLQKYIHNWDVVAVATVQEEIGLFGAVTSAYHIAPDIAIAIDVTFAKQYNDSDHGTFSLDKGPTIGIGPNLHPALVKRLRKTAEQQEIPVDLEPLSGSSGTDAWAIQISRQGIPTGLLSIPVRYMHQPVETASLTDIERTARLLGHFIIDLEPEYTPSWESENV